MSQIVANGTAILKDVAAKGRAYTDARNSITAHLLAIGVTQKTIVDEAGLDKGDVSRVNKVLGTLPAAQVKKIKGLSLSGMSADNVETLATAVTLGALFRRQKPQPGSKESKADKVEETVDVAALITAWLMDATPGQYTARLDILTNVIDTVAAERAAQAA